MNSMHYATCVGVLLTSTWTVAADTAGCPDAEVRDHVLQQFRAFGPRSRNIEYFGFVYRFEGVIASATSHGGQCRWAQSCEVSAAKAAAKIPKGAKVLGEWHTHPHETGTQNISEADARGAFANRNIRCYRPFFSGSDGSIYMWDATAPVAVAAMQSRTKLGNYRDAIAASNH